jgi:hypothetical protein
MLLRYCCWQTLAHKSNIAGGSNNFAVGWLHNNRRWRNHLVVFSFRCEIFLLHHIHMPCAFVLNDVLRQGLQDPHELIEHLVGL